MRGEKGTVRAPEIGHVWLNSSPLSFRGRIVLVDFWDYTADSRRIRSLIISFPKSRKRHSSMLRAAGPLPRNTEAVGDGLHSLKVKYEASAVNLVMAPPRGASAEVLLLQDGRPVTGSQAGRNTRSRTSGTTGESYVVVDSARMYSLVDNHEFGEHEIELVCSEGVAAFAFTFTGCVDPVAGALHATTGSIP